MVPVMCSVRAIVLLVLLLLALLFEFKVLLFAVEVVVVGEKITLLWSRSGGMRREDVDVVVVAVVVEDAGSSPLLKLRLLLKLLLKVFAAAEGPLRWEGVRGAKDTTGRLANTDCPSGVLG